MAWGKKIHFNVSDMMYIEYIRREHTYNSNPTSTPTYIHRRYPEMNPEGQKGVIQIYNMDYNIISYKLHCITVSYPYANSTPHHLTLEYALLEFQDCVIITVVELNSFIPVRVSMRT